MQLLRLMALFSFYEKQKINENLINFVRNHKNSKLKEINFISLHPARIKNTSKHNWTRVESLKRYASRRSPL